MPAHHRCLLAHAAGRVLDVGAGAGQHALALQQRGLTVTAIDYSPGAVMVCRERGIGDVRQMDARALHFSSERFETVLLMGNNLGLAGTPAGLRRLLRDLRSIVPPHGQILAEFIDYGATRDPVQLRYHHRNRALGCYPGTMRLRHEYAGVCGPNFEWLLITLEDLRTFSAETGWHIRRCIQVNDLATYAICLGQG
jgi:SAM-dependent methyltransferase